MSSVLKILKVLCLVHITCASYNYAIISSLVENFREDIVKLEENSNKMLMPIDLLISALSMIKSHNFDHVVV